MDEKEGDVLVKRYGGEPPQATRERWHKEIRRRIHQRWGLEKVHVVFFRNMKKRGKKGKPTERERREWYYAEQNWSRMGTTMRGPKVRQIYGDIELEDSYINTCMPRSAIEAGLRGEDF